MKTEAQKRAQKKYYQKNKETLNKVIRENANKYYKNNKEKVLTYKKSFYVMKKICQEFRNILIDDFEN